MKNLQVIQTKIEKIKDSITSTPVGIIEEDTSISFTWGKDQSWNLPNAFLTLRNYQLDVHKAVLQDGYKRVFLAWSRRLGKEVTSWLLLLKYAFTHRCSTMLVYPNIPQAKRVFWKGKMNDVENGGSVDFLDFLPPFIDREKAINGTSFRIDLPNGSDIWVVGSENYDSLRGVSAKFILFSEHAFQDPAAYRSLRPVIAQNDGIILVQTTWDGRNHSYKLWQNVNKSPKWFCSFLTAETARDENGERFITEESIQQMRDEGESESFIQQEYFMSVEGDDEKYVFGETISGMRSSGHIGDHAWKPGNLVYSCWDIGVKDATAISIIQVLQGQPVVVAYFEFKGTTYEHDIEQITKWRQKRNLGLGFHVLPHDGKNRSKATDGLVPQDATQYISNKLGEPCRAIDKPKAKEYCIRLMRAYLPRFKIDQNECSRLIECLSSHTKEYDRKNDVYKQIGNHDWTSHAVDSIQTACLALEKDMFISRVRQTVGRYI